MEISRVGPRGYIHGWIFVGAPGAGAKVFHPHHGHGTVTSVNDGHARVTFGSGREHAFEVKPTAAPGHQFKPRQARPALEGNAVHDHLGTPTLSKPQRDTLARYQSALYHQMDAYLNTGNIHAADDEMGSHVISEAEMAKQIKNLDAAFKAASPTTRPVTVYRGMTMPHATPGTTWTDKTPVSTSTDRAIGDQYRQWAESDQAKLVRITVPAGSTAISMKNALHQNVQAGEEAEVLLPRDSRFRVTGVSGNVVEAELLPRGEVSRDMHETAGHMLFRLRTAELCRTSGMTST